MRAKEAAATKALEIIQKIYGADPDFPAHTGPLRIAVGSGSTVAIFMQMLSKATWLPDNVICAPSSYQAEELVSCSPKLNLDPSMEPEYSDFVIDGADEVYTDAATGSVYMIKGGGGAMTGEKIVASASRKRIYMVDETKVSPNGLGQRRFPIPVEVVPKYRFTIKMLLEQRLTGFECSLRQAPGGKAGPVVTDNGNVIIDMKPHGIFDHGEVERVLDGVPGVVGHGLFSLHVDHLIVGYNNGDAKV